MCFTQGRAVLLVAYLPALYSDGYYIGDRPDKDYYIGKRFLPKMFFAINKTGSSQDNLLECGIAEVKANLKYKVNVGKTPKSRIHYQIVSDPFYDKEAQIQTLWVLMEDGHNATISEEVGERSRNNEITARTSLQTESF
ncbi:unnamed protein product [Clavelina lepadiformis]|uniref:Uncharacterized protein n=1 Tax=Clavelina lepadiformis TaxID=159417 RepID=A0ABP0F3I6_CLALP